MNATVPDILFYVFAATVVFCAVRVVTVPHIFRAALYLAGALGVLGAMYLLLHAEFVAIVQVLVYVGAVVILIIFAVMLTAQLGDAAVAQTNKLNLPGALVALAVFGLLVPILYHQDWGSLEPAKAAEPALNASSNIQAIGRSLMSTYVFPFELVAMVLLTALVGAVVIARKDPES